MSFEILSFFPLGFTVEKEQWRQCRANKHNVLSGAQKQWKAKLMLKRLNLCWLCWSVLFSLSEFSWNECSQGTCERGTDSSFQAQTSFASVRYAGVQVLCVFPREKTVWAQWGYVCVLALCCVCPVDLFQTHSEKKIKEFGCQQGTNTTLPPTPPHSPNQATPHCPTKHPLGCILLYHLPHSSLSWKHSE